MRRLASATASGPLAAILPASSRTLVISSAAGTTWSARPMRSASAAEMRSPVKHSSLALATPTRRARRWVPPKPGMTPSATSGWPNFALSAATMKSQASASSQPPPRAKPLTAAIHGLAECSTAWPRLPPISANVWASAGPRSFISAMSAPATNALLPAPVTTTTRMSSASSSSAAAWVRSAMTRLDSALSAASLRMVTMARCPSCSTVTVS